MAPAMNEDDIPPMVSLMSMMCDLSRGQLAFLVGYMTAENFELAAEAYTALILRDIPDQ